MIIDTHAHLMFEQFDGEVEAVIERAKAAGVTTIINIGCGKESSFKAVEMADKYPSLYATVGLHPYDAEEFTAELFVQWEKLIMENQKIVAIGECGLDYVKCEVDKEVQKATFREHLKLADKTGLPVVVHGRGAEEDCLTILEEFPNVYAVFHCYGGDVNLARRLWGKGYLTSFTGVITYPTAGDYIEIIDEVPMDKFMVETDCPYLAPQEYRGKRNEPAYVVEVVNKIAQIKEIPVTEVVRMSTDTAKSFFLRMP